MPCMQTLPEFQHIFHHECPKEIEVRSLPFSGMVTCLEITDKTVKFNIGVVPVVVENLNTAPDWLKEGIVVKVDLQNRTIEMIDQPC